MKETGKMPLVILRGMVIMPGSICHFDIRREDSVKSVEAAMMGDQSFFAVTQKTNATEHPEVKDLYPIGTVAKIHHIVRLPQKIFHISAEGMERGQLLEVDETRPYPQALLESVPEGDFSDCSADEREAMLRLLREALREYASYTMRMEKDDVLGELLKIQEPERLLHRAAAGIPFPYEAQQRLLNAVSIKERFEILLSVLAKENSVRYFKMEIQNKVRERLDKNQREYVLREELQLIRKELGEDTVLTDAERFEKAIQTLKAPAEVKDKLKKELQRFKGVVNHSAETGVVRSYIETMLEMPWEVRSKDNANLKRAERILQADHYGLQDVKERVLEFLAVRILTKKGESPILCLVGPPGTGKTSIAKSIARALNRQYVRISLGGVRDEAEIRGHRKTYVGAMPGRIASGLQIAGTKNPLMLLDEIDKVSTDYKGDTFSALLEVLDSEQNHRFRDHYLEVPLDLSDVLFVTTANTTETIPRPLLDRMEIITIDSYTENEKAHIAHEHLFPKQKKRHGIDEKRLTVSPAAMKQIIRLYTREAGVRQLERKLGEICRKGAREILEEKKDKISVTRRNLEHYLGKPVYRAPVHEKKSEIGIAQGLAWTQVGGVSLQIEVNIMDGTGQLLLTGQLGEVMKESARAGISYIRSVAPKYHVPEDFFQKKDIHIHIPEGAVPKDGPSAGITMATALISAVTGKRIRSDVAMTGEITLRGRVLPVGGLKEKLLAAKNAGMHTVILPAGNRGDVDNIAPEITDGLSVCYVETMDRVLAIALRD